MAQYTFFTLSMDSVGIVHVSGDLLEIVHGLIDICTCLKNILETQYMDIVHGSGDLLDIVHGLLSEAGTFLTLVIRAMLHCCYNQ